MGRIDTDASPHQQGNDFDEVHHIPAGDPPPPPPFEEDLYVPPADYQPPPPQVHSFPPPPDHDDDVKPQSFPPQQQQHYINPGFPQPPAQQMHNINNNNVNVGQAQQAGIPMGFVPQQTLLQNQPWKTHLFDCMKDPQNAIITLFFPCVTFGQIAEVVDNGSTSCATSGILYSLIACCIGMPCLISCGYRSKLRARFRLVETPAPDFLIHCFCECCALCQEYRELSLRGFDPSIGHAGNVAKQQQMQFGMTPPLQQRMNF